MNPTWLAMGLVLMAAPGAATPYDGLYRSNGEADCAEIGVEGGALRIRDGLFEGIGSACQMTRPVDVVDMDATLYTMECTAGDTRWTERALLMKAAQDEGLIMLWNGYAFRYASCDAPVVAEESATPSAAEVTEAPPATQEADALAATNAADAPGTDGLPPPRIVLPSVVLPRVVLPSVALPAAPEGAGDAPAAPDDGSGEARGGTAAQVEIPDEAG
ncbi:hypothetical protein [Limimaricola litoreus]|uniref:Uncharacterized protein n=1 Tax=Limimaricola litoreus TaxID=2955316 RepID=A0A9X2JP28_9RHOB|nr:hypothetical protein [Limimaricola litoreus]MCP1169123.1 hypothetical protein [Limimaricola litoreus]